MLRPVLLLGLASALLGAQTPDLGRLRRDVFALASPAFQGRATGEPGQRKAAAYIAARMKANGLKPLKGPGMGGDTPFHFPYALIRTRVDAEATTLEREGVSLRLGRDFVGFPMDSAAGEAVFLGYGVRAPELGWDDYGEVDVRGRWVVLLSGQPRSGPFQDQPRHPAATEAAKQQAADAAGALGVILLPGTHPGDPDLQASHTRMERYLRRPRLAPEGEPAAIPLPRRLGLTASGARALGLDPAALQQAQDGSGRPAAPRALGRLALNWVQRTERVEASDLAGFIPGTDPGLKDEVVLVSAHHDHLGLAGEVLHPGADDDASGTAGILEAARLLRKARPRRSILFLSVSGEENGLWGSQAFVSRPPLPLDRVVADLNLDMIGRGRPDELHVTPARIEGAVTTLTAEARRLGAAQGLPLSCGAESYWRRSDHFNFARKGIPAVFFFAGMHEDYHRPTDTPDKIDYRKLAKVVRLARDLALSVANAPDRPRPVPKEEYEAWDWIYTATAPEPSLKP